MLSFFKLPFSSSKHTASGDNHDNVLLDILRKRQCDKPELPERRTWQIMDKFKKLLSGNSGCPPSPDEQYEAMRKILQDLDNELR